MMRSKERVFQTLNHREPDRVPIDYWASPEVSQRLMNDLHLDGYEDLLGHFNVDLRYISGPQYRGPELKRYPDGSVEDIWGVPRRRVTIEGKNYRGAYEEVILSPLREMTTVREIDDYKHWPSPDWWDYSQLALECDRYSEYAVVYSGDRLDRTAQLKTAMYMRGMEQIMVDLALDPKIVKAVLSHITEYFFEFNKRVFEATEGKIDVFMMGDDFGGQKGLLVSVDMWRKVFKANFRKYVDLAHHYGIKVMHHTCGSVKLLVPEFIDCGLDILQSLQPRAKDMDLMTLKQEFGKYLTFHGSIDIQETLPLGTVGDVRKEVKERMQAGKPGGGFIICTAHNLQFDTPLENMIALFDSYVEYGYY